MSRPQLAKAGCRCDYALYVGAASDNASILPAIASKAAGLKMYLNDTYSTLKMDNVSLWMEVGGVTLPYLIAVDLLDLNSNFSVRFFFLLIYFYTSNFSIFLQEIITLL